MLKDRVLFSKKYLRDLRIQFRNWLFKKQVKNKDFTLISNNCWGAVAYQELELPYRTPFVGLSIFAPCYLRLLSNFQEYMNLPLTFIAKSRYEFVNEQREQGKWSSSPIGLLGDDVEIHFLHYSSESEAREKWNRRTHRINWDRLFFKFCDNPPDGFNEMWGDEYLFEFDKLSFLHKVCFSAKNYPELKSNVWMREPECLMKSHVYDGITTYKFCRKYFDLADWLNGGSGKIGQGKSMLNTLLYW